MITSKYIRESTIIDNQKQEPGYYAIIPAGVRYDKKLPANAKLLYGEISSLCNKKGYCWAGNAYFADLYDTSERTIINWINALRDAGHISVEFSYIPGKKEIQSRLIRLADIGAIKPERSPAPPQTNSDMADGNPGQEVVKKSSPRGEKNFTTYGKNLQEVVKKFSPRGENFFMDNITTSNNTATTTTADTPESGIDPPDTVAAASVTPPELKKALAEIDPTLVLDREFYSKAVVFMAANGLDLAYLAWLYEQCKAKKPRSLDGLYYTLFFTDNMAEKFRAFNAVSREAQPPPVVCPVCGLSHDAHEIQCPHCGLKLGATSAEIHNQREIFNLPPEKRAAYLERETAMILECGSDFIKAKVLLAALRKEFGLSWL